MRLLGSNEFCDGVLPLSVLIDERFVSYYKKPDQVSADGKEVLFKFFRPPKYRFVTVPKKTRYEKVVFASAQHTAMEPMFKIKDGDEVEASNSFHDPPKWEKATLIGSRAPDPKYPAHRQYRRVIA